MLGVDPGLTRCGLAVVRSGARRTDVALGAVGVARSDAGLAVPLRLARVTEQVEQWVVEHRPDVVAIEQVFMQRNTSNALGTAQLVGAVSVAAVRRGVQVATYTPTQVKAAVTGHGGAHKDQVGAMVARVLGLDEVPKPADAADAVAIALTHLWAGGGVNARGGSGAAGKTAAQRAWADAAAASRVVSWDERLVKQRGHAAGRAKPPR